MGTVARTRQEGQAQFEAWARETTRVDVATGPSDTDRGPFSIRLGPVDIHLGWLAAAVLSIFALGAFLPAGLWLLVFLGVIILTHEGGHLLAARAAGMKPTEYFWGFGPEILAVEHKGCRYGIKTLSLGGYVRIEGMTPSSEIPEGFDEADTYRAARHRGRLGTILAGPFTNLALALVALSAAELRAGRGWLGAGAEALRVLNLVISATVMALWSWFGNIGGYLQAVFGDTSSAPVRFLSPVAQAQVSGQVVESGVDASLYWFAILSCAVGIINLLPLPPLDGSHALVALTEGLVEKLTGRRVSFDVTRLIPLAYVTIGALLVLSLTALVMDLRDLSVL